MVYLKENYILRFQRGPAFYRGGGPNFSRGGANVNIELVNFRGGGGWWVLVSQSRKTGFLMQWLIFYCSSDY